VIEFRLAQAQTAQFRFGHGHGRKTLVFQQALQTQNAQLAWRDPVQRDLAPAAGMLEHPYRAFEQPHEVGTTFALPIQIGACGDLPRVADVEDIAPGLGEQGFETGQVRVRRRFRTGSWRG